MMNDIKLDATNRGFMRGEFADSKGVACSIQESSLATESAIWLGCNEIGLQRFEPYKGWSEVALEQDAPHGIVHVANTRMHLTQEQVAALLPLLQHFVETGELPSAEKTKDSDDE